LGLVASHLKNLLDVAPIYCPLKKIAICLPACLLPVGGKDKILPLGGMDAAGHMPQKNWLFLSRLFNV
jgi:hypothetical protein